MKILLFFSMVSPLVVAVAFILLMLGQKVQQVMQHGLQDVNHALRHETARHVPSRFPSVSRSQDNNVCHNPTGSQGNSSTNAPDLTIRRPWDTAHPSQPFNTQSSRNSMLKDNRGELM
jgi:hypothetical protein